MLKPFVRFLATFGGILFSLFSLSSLRGDDGPAVYDKLLQSTAWVRSATEGVGTGWVVDARRRWLVTNLHVVGDRDGIEAFFVAEKDGRPIGERQFYLENQTKLHEEGRAVRGKVMLRRKSSDLALIELEKLPPGIAALPLAKTLPGPGERVHSLGNRHDADALWLYSVGEVRQIGRLTDGYFWHGQKIAADAPCFITQSPIEPGDSGGALANERGEVVGVLSGGRWQAPLASIAIQVGEVRRLLAEAEKGPPSDAKEEIAPGTAAYRKMLRATAWVRPSATEGRSAGWVVDRPHRLLLTTSTRAGPFDLVDVVFPQFVKDSLIGEGDAYADRIGLRKSGQLVRGLVLTRDRQRDLALIELDSLPPGTIELPWAMKEPAPAERVHALSHPSGVELLWLYSSGAVRQVANLEAVSPTMGEALKPRTLLLQIPHQAGSAGGPLTNDRGEVVGLLTAKEGVRQQLGYALASLELQAFIESARPLFAPRSADDFHRRGTYGSTRRRDALAVSALTRAVALDPKNRRPLLDLVEALARAGKTELLSEQIRQLNADSVEEMACAAKAFLLIDNRQEALAWSDRLLKKDSRNAVGYFVRGSCREGKEALADLDQAIFLAPELGEAYRFRAAIHLSLGNDDGALADYSRSIELDPYTPEPIRSRAEIYLKKNEPKRAVADFEKLIDLLPKEASFHRSLARAWLRQGDEDKAIPALVAALRWQPSLTKPILEDAVKHGAELVRRWPDDPSKKAAWYERLLKEIGGVVDPATSREIGTALKGRKEGWDAIVWGEELEKRMRRLVR